ncbi:MAG: indolepyruvate oxidoreductase subunit beta [Spirochaetia bacterium]|nr:indolepyruvate oxidoreductase subunit beta [Spirochaetia bacterium]
MKATNILIVGVGGQGIVAASDIIADMALTKGLDVKKSEIHGMSQRGGVVSSFVRYGEKIYSSIPFRDEIDFILSFEEMESIRAAEYINNDTIVIVNTQRIKPATLHSITEGYPDAKTSIKHDRLYLIDAIGEAKKTGNEKVVNSLMIGALSYFLHFDEADFMVSLQKRVKKMPDENRTAYNKGKELVKNYVL